MDKINQIWTSWHTVELIGRGGFGEVYKAKREQLGEVFYSAVKIIQIPKEEIEIKEMLADGHTSESVRYYYESVVKGLMNEIKVMDALKSAGNVVNIEEFDVREREDSIGWDAYIRMELLQNLNDYRKDHMMGQKEVAKLGADLCEALVCCEKSHIIHRDIKPSNIFVDKYGTFKLGDFGIARQMEKTQSTLSRKGTELYMAPEVRYGKSGSTYNVDIYSLGLVMYRLLNRNRMPFEPIDKELMSYQEREEALVRRLEGEPIPLPANCDPQLGMIIRKACEYDKEKRYQRAGEMKSDLEAWIGKKPFASMAGGTTANRTANSAENSVENSAENSAENRAAKSIGQVEKPSEAEDKTAAAFDTTVSSVWSSQHSANREAPVNAGKPAHEENTEKRTKAEESKETVPEKKEEPGERFLKEREAALKTEKDALSGRKAKRAYIAMVICAAAPLLYMFFSIYLFPMADFPYSLFLCLAASGLLVGGVILIKKERRAGKILCMAGGFLTVWIVTLIFNSTTLSWTLYVYSVTDYLPIFSLFMTALFYKWSRDLEKGKEQMKKIVPGEMGLIICGVAPVFGFGTVAIENIAAIVLNEFITYPEHYIYPIIYRFVFVAAICALIFLGKKFVQKEKKAGIFMCAAGGMISGYFVMKDWLYSFIYQALYAVMHEFSYNEWDNLTLSYWSGSWRILIPAAAGIIVAVLCYRWAKSLMVHKTIEEK